MRNNQWIAIPPGEDTLHRPPPDHGRGMLHNGTLSGSLQGRGTAMTLLER